MNAISNISQLKTNSIDYNDFDPINYIHTLSCLFFLTWKFKWKRFREKIELNDWKILRVFGRLKGREYIYVNGETEPIKFYGTLNLFFLFWYHFFILSKQFFRKMFSREKIESPKKKSMEFISKQFNITIEFLYFGYKLFEKKTIEDKDHNRFLIKNSEIIHQILKKIVPKKQDEKKPYRKNLYLFFLAIYSLWLYLLIFILPNFFFPDYSVGTKVPIINEIITTQIPILAFWIFVYLLLSKFEKLLLFTEDYYDKNLKSSEMDVPSSFQMRYELKIASYNTAMYVYLFLFGFNMYGLGLLINFYIKNNFNFLKAWTTLIDLYFYSNILVLWALNFGFWTVAIYIIGMVTFGQYHISKNFKFLFDIYQSPKLDAELQKFVKTVCFYSFTASFLIYSSGLVWFLTIRSISTYLLTALIIIFIAIVGLVLFLFIISLIGWKRTISDQKKEVLERAIKRRDFLIDKLNEKQVLEENNKQLFENNFQDVTELRFLHEQISDIRTLKEWLVSAEFLFSILISAISFIPDIFAYLQALFNIK